MQESMMIAEVGGMVNVSGSRIATPFAPPSPGSTPMITPRITPTNISIRLNGVSATLNPCRSEVISAKRAPLVELQPGLERAFRQRQLEPDFEQQEEDDADPDRDQRRREPRIAPEPPHEERDEGRRGHVQAHRLDQHDVDDRRQEHPQDLPERAARHERL